MKNSFGKTVKKVRVDAGLSRAEVAKAAGLTRQFLWLVELDRRDISMIRAHRLARALGTTLIKLLTLTQN